MFSRLGLRARTAVTYVAISAAAVLVAEAIILALALSQVANANRAGHVQTTPGPGWWLSAGAAVLVLLVPLGALFAMLSTRRLIRQIRRLAKGAAAVAGGDLRFRVPVSGKDELGQLEEGFNRMAGQLEAALRAERETARGQARQAERNRIARDLHDSISQDLFSSSLLAAALRRALPAGTPPQRQAEALERAIEGTMREMRALLLELRPAALEDAGLAPALQDLCQAYQARLGLRIVADIRPPHLEPDIELVVLRVAQEALGNAARHAEARVIELTVADGGGELVVTVADDGLGFDPAQLGERHGMGLGVMRERVSECGGTLEVRGVPGEGTMVRARLPVTGTGTASGTGTAVPAGLPGAGEAR